jgi:hypothetical protein
MDADGNCTSWMVFAYNSFNFSIADKTNHVALLEAQRQRCNELHRVSLAIKTREYEEDVDYITIESAMVQAAFVSNTAYFNYLESLPKGFEKRRQIRSALNPSPGSKSGWLKYVRALAAHARPQPRDPASRRAAARRKAHREGACKTGSFKSHHIFKREI